MGVGGVSNLHFTKTGFLSHGNFQYFIFLFTSSDQDILLTNISKQSDVQALIWLDQSSQKRKKTENNNNNKTKRSTKSEGACGVCVWVCGCVCVCMHACMQVYRFSSLEKEYGVC